MAEILLFNSVFHDEVTLISVSTLKHLLGINRGYTTEILSISYSRNSYIRLIVTLYFAILIINKDKFLLNSISGIQWQYTKSVLIPISDFFLFSEIAIMQQTDGTAHKLKPRSFNKSIYLWVHLIDFHSWCKLCLTVLSDSQVCCCFWAVLSAKSSVVVLFAKQSSTSKSKITSYCNSSTSTLVPLLGTPFNTISHFSDYLAYLPNTPQQSR